MKKYIVIGGQYQSYYYGEADGLRSAKIIASKHLEYWDNWQGWHYPSIYRAEDVERVNNFYGEGYMPKQGVWPIATRAYGDKAWNMEIINMGFYCIIGKNAEKAADYIKNQERRMIEVGAANSHFPEDYQYNMDRFRRKASELYGVVYDGMMIDI